MLEERGGEDLSLVRLWHTTKVLVLWFVCDHSGIDRYSDTREKGLLYFKISPISEAMRACTSTRRALFVFYLFLS
jgi:hypothetical protein